MFWYLLFISCWEYKASYSNLINKKTPLHLLLYYILTKLTCVSLKLNFLNKNKERKLEQKLYIFIILIVQYLYKI